jgi:catechol 2,3-dioxygenase-like lactoylglutathione lyase family enzyme
MAKKAKKKTRKAAAPKAARKPTTKRAASKAAPRATLNIRTTAPSFTVNDLQRSLAWYRDVLGFAVAERWEIEGVLQGVQLSAGPVSFMLSQDDWKKGRDRVKGEGIRLYCTTGQNVDHLAARIKAGGGTLMHEPRDEWGMRALSVEDPDGFKITIAANLKKR